jgi:hypothetical protein
VDQNAYGSIDVRRAFMTVGITKLDFHNGILTAVRIRKDSEALAASEFPLRAIERLIAVPGNGIAVAFGTYAQKSQYLQQQQTLATSANSAQPPPAVPVGLLDVGSCLTAAAFPSVNPN